MAHTARARVKSALALDVEQRLIREGFMPARLRWLCLGIARIGFRMIMLAMDRGSGLARLSSWKPNRVKIDRANPAILVENQSHPTVKPD